MPTRDRFVKHVLQGGWASDFGPSSDASFIDQNDQVPVPFLVTAENLTYILDGGTQKSPGTSKLNSTELESGAEITGIFDAWLSGTSGTPTQHRIIHIGTKIKKDDADGSFSDIFTGMEADAIPSYTMFGDLIIIASDSTTDVPKSWDGTTAQNLAGSPPNFSFSTEHKNRLWASGNAALPSRLYYSTYLDAENWTTSGSGHIDISPDDGDVVTGLASHKNDLWVFKGPHKGSITRITGSAPTGPDGFSRIPFVNGVGSVNHNSLFTFAGGGRGDLGFVWSDGSIRSLNATAAFGDYAESALSRPIHGWIRGHLSFSRLKFVWADNYDDGGYVLFTLSKDSSLSNNTILMMDYRFTPVRWSEWPAYKATSLMRGIDPEDNNRIIMFTGGPDGFVRKLNQPERSIDGMLGIDYKMTLPFFNYGSSILMKFITAVSLSLAPKNNGNILFSWTRDNKAAQTQNIDQGGSDVLGPASNNQFTLGVSSLAGSSLVDKFAELEEGGEFRGIQYQISNSVNLEDTEVHTISTALASGAWSTEND